VPVKLFVPDDIGDRNTIEAKVEPGVRDFFLSGIEEFIPMAMKPRTGLTECMGEKQLSVKASGRHFSSD
jgi:hypothetical protein